MLRYLIIAKKGKNANELLCGDRYECFSLIYEYEEVLLRNTFGLDESSVKVLIDELKKRAIFLDRTEIIEKFDDPDDIVFYEIVMTARTSVEAYLITGNKKHYPIKPFVVTPREMLDIVGE